MFQLTKFCKKEFNPLFECKTIQLGTLKQYREEEATKNIADPNEGAINFYVEHYSSKEDDSGTNHFGFIGNNINMHGCYVQRVLPNCYIFCLSTNSNLNGEQFDSEYCSSYKIKNLNGFILQTTQILRESISLKNFEEFCVQNIHSENGFRKRLEIIVFHDKVVYNSTKSHKIESAKEIKFRNIPNEFQILFTKDTHYINDSEYRISFIFKYRNRILIVKKNPILIPTEKLIKFIE